MSLANLQEPRIRFSTNDACLLKMRLAVSALSQSVFEMNFHWNDALTGRIILTRRTPLLLLAQLRIHGLQPQRYWDYDRRPWAFET